MIHTGLRSARGIRSTKPKVIVWCRTCEAKKETEAQAAIAHGLPRCCGQTMDLSPPRQQRKRLERKLRSLGK